MLSSSTFLIVSIQDLASSSNSSTNTTFPIQPENNIFNSNSFDGEFISPHSDDNTEDHEFDQHNSFHSTSTLNPIAQSVERKMNTILREKILHLIHTGTQLRWVYVTQFSNVR